MDHVNVIKANDSQNTERIPGASDGTTVVCGCTVRQTSTLLYTSGTSTAAKSPRAALQALRRATESNMRRTSDGCLSSSARTGLPP